MTPILLFVALGFTVVHAGVQTLPPLEDFQKMQEFSRLCLSGQIGPYGQEIGGVQVYCKVATGRRQEGFSHFQNKPFEGPKSQAVFVRPPPLELTHNVTVRGNFKGSKTQVYVVPSPVDNKYVVDVSGRHGPHEKPTVYYLQGSTTEQPDSEPGTRYLPPKLAGNEYAVSADAYATASHKYKTEQEEVLPPDYDLEYGTIPKLQG